MQKIVVIGKLYERNKLNGPGNVIYQLQQPFSKLNADFKYILNNESNSFIQIIRDIILKILFKKGLVVNVHTDGFILALIVYLVSLLNRKNHYYLTVHGIYKIESAMSETTKNRYLKLEKILYKKFDNIICVSSKLAEDIKSIYGRSKNVYVVNNGTQEIPLTTSHDNKLDVNRINLIFVGGINRRKGILETISVLKYIIDNSDIDVHLDIYGSVENSNIKEKYEQYVIDNNLEDYVTYHGLVRDKEELFSYYAKSTFQLCLSLYDTFNVAVLESMAVGCPCILSDCCGARDIIEDGGNGYIVSLGKRTGETILNIIREVGHDPQKLKQLKKRTRMTAEHNTWDVVANKYYKLFKGEYDGNS